MRKAGYSPSLITCGQFECFSFYLYFKTIREKHDIDFSLWFQQAFQLICASAHQSVCCQPPSGYTGGVCVCVIPTHGWISISDTAVLTSREASQIRCDDRNVANTQAPRYFLPQEA